MRPTALMSLYVRMVFLLAIGFFSLFNCTASFAQQKQVVKPGQLANTIGEDNDHPSVDLINIVVDEAGKITTTSISADTIHIVDPRPSLPTVSTINYTPQKISDIIKECPA